MEIKNILLLIGVAGTFVLCSSEKSQNNKTKQQFCTEANEAGIKVEKITTSFPTGRGLHIVTIDSCEYVTYYDYKSETGIPAVITHKGNCKYCMERNKK